MDQIVTLYRPVGPEELRLIRESGWTRFPPRLREQPIFYPVVEEEYARKIAKNWNVKANGSGYVLRFHLSAGWLGNYDVHKVGGREHSEYWIPAEDLDDLNANLVGLIEVIAEYHLDEWEVAYDLAEDHETIAVVQRATLATGDFGVVPDIALFGSKEWWTAIDDGRIPRRETRGIISRVYSSGHDDWPEFEVTSNGVQSTWTRMGRQTLYAPGKEAKVEYVLQRLKKNLPAQEHYKQVLRILIKNHGPTT